MLRLGVLCLFFSLLCGIAKAQEGMDGLLKRLASYTETLPQERVYLHLDKDSYALQEDIWLKAYVTTSAYNFLSAISKIMYVELIDPQDRLVESLRLPVFAGLSIGDFKLGDSLRAGKYRVRAYTNWMRNFDERYFYDREILIGDVQQAERTAVERSNTLQLYAESGILLEDGPNRVTVLAKDGHGKGVDIEGHVEDEQGERVAEIQMGPRGVGTFNISPQAGQRYWAAVRFVDGDERRFELPDVVSEGFQLSVNNGLDDVLIVQLRASQDLVDERPINVVVHHKGQVYYAVKGKLESNATVVRVPKSSIPSGVAAVSVLDDDLNLLSERYVFNNNPEAILPLTLETDHQIYGRDSDVTVRIASGYAQDTARYATFSLAVIPVDETIDSAVYTPTIYSSLQLSEAVKIDIEDPAYYFRDDSLQRMRELDRVMLTIGKDMSFWDIIKSGKKPDFTYQSEKQLQISGMVSQRNGTPAPGARITLLATRGSDVAVLDTVANDSGRFSFDKVIFYDDAEFLVQGRDARGRRNVEVRLDSVPSQKTSPKRNASEVLIGLDASARDTVRRQQDLNYDPNSRSILLEEVRVQAEKVNPARHSANLNGPGNADQVFADDDLFMTCPTLDMCLQGRLVGIMFRNGVPYSTRSFNRPMQLIVDGMYVDSDFLRMLPPVDVASVEILRTIHTTAIYGSFGSSGVMIITTKRGDHVPTGTFGRSASGLATLSPQGYYPARLFETPRFGASPSAVTKSTLFWEPGIVTDALGQASVAFNTHGRAGRYMVVLEGLDLNGRLVRETAFIRVEEDE